MSNRVSKEDLIAEFRRLADELGKRPTLGEFEEGQYSSTPVYKRFESYEALKEAAGFESGEKKIADETLLDDLRRVAEKIGRSPPLKVYNEHSEHDAKTLKRRFGSWSEVLETAGLNDTGHAKHWKDNDPEQFGKNYGSVEVACEYCGQPKYVKPSRLECKDRFFCNHSCRGQFMSEQTGEDARAWKGGMVEIECEQCGDTRQVKRAETEKARFCGQPCMLEWRSETLVGENHHRYKEDTEELYYGPSFPKQRQQALERDNHECRLCGKTEGQQVHEYGCGLNCHHIRKFKEYDSHERANDLRNLITLCSRCHQQVENNKVTVPAAVWHRQEAMKAVQSAMPLAIHL